MTRSFPTHAALVALAIVLGGVMCEGGLRLAGFAPNNFSVNANFADHTWSQPDRVLGWTNRPGPGRSFEAGEAVMNFWEDGRRASRPDREKRGSSLVYLFGSSFTQGYSVVDKETFAYLLNERYQDIVFENLGVGGYGLYQSYLLARRALEKPEAPAPTLIVQEFSGSLPRRDVSAYDWVVALTDARGHMVVPPHVTVRNHELVEHGGHIEPAWPLEGVSAAVALLHRGYLRLLLFRRETEPTEASHLLIQNMQRLARDHGSRLLVLLLWRKPDGLKDFLAASGIEYVDCMSPSWPSNPDPALKVGGTGHPNGIQHRLWAECLASWIDRNMTHPLPARVAAPN